MNFSVLQYFRLPLINVRIWPFISGISGAGGRTTFIAPLDVLDKMRNIREKGRQRDRDELKQMAHDQNAADQRIDDVENQGQLHLLLTNDGCEWISFYASVSPRVTQIT